MIIKTSSERSDSMAKSRKIEKMHFDLLSRFSLHKEGVRYTSLTLC